MATCALNEKQVELLYKLTVLAMQGAADRGDTFGEESIKALMTQVYTMVRRSTNDPVKGALFAQAIPAIIEKARSAPSFSRILTEVDFNPANFSKISQRVSDPQNGLLETFKFIGITTTASTKGSTTPPPVEITINTAWTSLPQELIDELQPQFDNYIKTPEFINIYGEYETLSEDKKIAVRQLWLKDQGAAIDAYNQKNKPAQQTPTKISLETYPNIDISDKTTLYELENLRAQMKRLQNQAKNDALKEKYTRDLEKLDSLIDARKQASATAFPLQTLLNQLESGLETLKSLFKGKTASGYELGDKTLNRVTRLVQNVLKERFEYVFNVSGSTKTINGIQAQLGKTINSFEDFKREFSSGVFLPISIEFGKENKVYSGFLDFSDARKERFFNAVKREIFDSGVFDPSNIEGTKRKTASRITDILIDMLYQEASVAGTVTDEVIRTILDGEDVDLTQEIELYRNEPKVKLSDYITEKAVADIRVLLQPILQSIERGEMQVISKHNVIYDVAGLKAAGEFDILLLDKDGNIKVLDIKTSKEYSWKIFGKERKSDDEYRKKKSSLTKKLIPDEAVLYRDRGKLVGYTLQQLLYKNMIFNIFGVEAKISLLPISLEYDSEGKVLAAERSDTIFTTGVSEDKIRVDFELDPTLEAYDVQKEENVTLQSVADELVPRVAPAVKLGDPNFVIPGQAAPTAPTAPAPASTTDTDTKDETATQKEVESQKTDGETRRQGLNGVEEIIFTNPNFRLEGFEIDGNYWNVVTSTDRAKVLVNINGVIVPFYLTTGQAGKGLVPGWYPFFGIGKDGWLNKTDKSDMETYYERYWGKETANIVKSISEELNSFYGTDPSTFKNDGDPNATSRPLSTLADKVEDYINSKLSYTPAINNADARKTLRSNVEQLGKEINAKYDAGLAAPVSIESERDSFIEAFQRSNPSTQDQQLELIFEGVSDRDFEIYEKILNNEEVPLGDAARASDNVYRALTRIRAQKKNPETRFLTLAQLEPIVQDLNKMLEVLETYVQEPFSTFDEQGFLEETVEEEIEEEVIPSNLKGDTLSENIGVNILYQGNVGEIMQTANGEFVFFNFENDEAIVLSNNGNTTLAELGMEAIVKGDSVFGVQIVENQRFTLSDLTDTSVKINNVDYTVNTDAAGNVQSLTFKTNQRTLDSLNKELEELNKQIDSQREFVNTQTSSFANLSKEEQRELVLKGYNLGEAQLKLNQLLSQRADIENKIDKAEATNFNVETRNAILVNLVNQTYKKAKKKLAGNKQEVFDAMSDIDSNGTEALLQFFDSSFPADVFEKLFTSDVNDIVESDISTALSWLRDTITKIEDTLETGDPTTQERLENLKDVLSSLANNLVKIKYNKDGKITKRGKTSREVIQGIRSTIPNLAGSLSDASNIQPGTAPGDTTKTQSEIDAAKADIKRRRQEKLNAHYENLTELISKEEAYKGNDRISKEINAKYDIELAKVLLKEMKAGKMVTEFTLAEQRILNNPAIRKSIDEELAALEGEGAEVLTEEEVEEVDKGSDFEKLKSEIESSSIDELYKFSSMIAELQDKDLLTEEEADELYSLLTTRESSSTDPVTPTNLEVDNIIVEKGFSVLNTGRLWKVTKVDSKNVTVKSILNSTTKTIPLADVSSQYEEKYNPKKAEAISKVNISDEDVVLLKDTNNALTIMNSTESVNEALQDIEKSNITDLLSTLANNSKSCD